MQQLWVEKVQWIEQELDFTRSKIRCENLNYENLDATRKMSKQGLHLKSERISSGAEDWANCAMRAADSADSLSWIHNGKFFAVPLR